MAATFHSFSNSQLHHYIQTGVPRLALELERSRQIPAEAAFKIAKECFDGHFPEQKLPVADHFVYQIREGDLSVGMMHFGVRREHESEYGYLWYLEIDESFRGKGFAKQALEFCAAELRARGLKRLLLNVFGHNTTAQELYKKSGYTVASMSMEKLL